MTRQLRLRQPWKRRGFGAWGYVKAERKHLSFAGQASRAVCCYARCVHGEDVKEAVQQSHKYREPGEGSVALGPVINRHIHYNLVSAPRELGTRCWREWKGRGGAVDQPQSSRKTPWKSYSLNSASEQVR
jgi:hypothetical protein